MRVFGSSKSTRVSGRNGSAASGGAAGATLAEPGAASSGADAAATGGVATGGALAAAGGIAATVASPLGSSCAGGGTAQPQTSAARVATASHAHGLANCRGAGRWIRQLEGEARGTVESAVEFIIQRAMATPARAHCPVITRQRPGRNSRR
jgi:hypothetical protein